MVKTILILLFASVLGLAHAQAALTEVELIEFLGEFDEEDELILEETMNDIEDKKANAGKPHQTSEVNDDVTHE